ncbi:MAG: hypothetical protein AAGG46_11180 [Planctomycetota bacterium]
MTRAEERDAEVAARESDVPVVSGRRGEQAFDVDIERAIARKQKLESDPDK